MVFVSKWIALAGGSLLGGFARYFLAGTAYRFLGTEFPYGTMIVNLSGCFLIGFLNGLTEVKFLLGPNAKVFLMIGFCGAFTTFSTFMLETSGLLKDGEFLRAFLNVAVSVTAGFLLFMTGEFAGRAL